MWGANRLEPEGSGSYPARARIRAAMGCPFLWFVSFWQAKEMKAGFVSTAENVNSTKLIQVYAE